MEPVSPAPGRVEERFSGSRPRIHHVAYVVPATEVADLRRSLDERGLSQYPASVRRSRDDSLSDARHPGHDIEIHADNEGLREFFGMVHGAAHGWTARNRSAGSRSDLPARAEHGAPGD